MLGFLLNCRHSHCVCYVPRVRPRLGGGLCHVCRVSCPRRQIVVDPALRRGGRAHGGVH